MGKTAKTYKISFGSTRELNRAEVMDAQLARAALKIYRVDPTGTLIVEDPRGHYTERYAGGFTEPRPYHGS